MAILGTNLYANHFDWVGAGVSLIRKFDGTSWSTVYTSVLANQPPLYLTVYNNRIFAWGRHPSTNEVATSTDGTTWTDILAQVGAGLTPAFGNLTS